MRLGSNVEPPETPEESWAWSRLEPEIRTSLEGQIDHALAKRSISGAMVYFVTALVIAFATPYYADHPAVITVAACLSFVIGASRTLASLRLLREPEQPAPEARRILVGSIYASAVVWGAFGGWTLHLYAAQWTAMLLLLTTAAFAGGATSSLSPSIRMASWSIVLLIAPPIVAAAAQGDKRSLALACGATMYLVFLLAQARDNGRAFLGASVAAERERIRGSADRLRAEIERATLVTAIEQAAEEILITRADGNITYCNPAFERVSGYERDEAIGQNPRFLKSGKHDARFYQDVWDTITSGQVWSGRFINRKKDGSIYEADGTISPIHDPTGKLSGFVFAGHDVTERLRMESQLTQARKMESIGRLAGGVAHDFNNLLTVIVGYCGILEDRLTDRDPRFEFAREIRKSAERAAGLTKQLLAFSRKQLIAPKAINLDLLIADMYQMLQRLLGDDIEVIAVSAPGLGLVRADPAQMNQVILNLAANARDAMPAGGKLTLRTANVESEGVPEIDSGQRFGPLGAVLLSVGDTGEGMDEEIRQQVFEPFFTTKEKGRGIGLGLSTVYGIVQQNNGSIEVLSEPGSGTTFQLYLPRIEDEAALEDLREPVPAPVRGSETVLVVEDQDELRRLIAMTLEGCGFRVLVAANGQAALAAAGGYPERIHLLLTDVIMPDLTGKEVADRLLNVRPDLKVLYTSGFSGEVISHRGVLDAHVEYLAKPFSPEILASKVRQVLGPAETNAE